VKVVVEEKNSQPIANSSEKSISSTFLKTDKQAPPPPLPKSIPPAAARAGRVKPVPMKKPVSNAFGYFSMWYSVLTVYFIPHL